MKVKLEIASILILFLGTILWGCSHHKRYKSIYHITNCTLPCSNPKTHPPFITKYNKHDCHVGHNEEGKSGQGHYKGHCKND